jgi:hypothetical protein
LVQKLDLHPTLTVPALGIPRQKIASELFVKDVRDIIETNLFLLFFQVGIPMWVTVAIIPIKMSFDLR